MKKSTKVIRFDDEKSKFRVRITDDIEVEDNSDLYYRRQRLFFKEVADNIEVLAHEGIRPETIRMIFLGNRWCFEADGFMELTNKG